jgi:DNA polymerase-3 subunit gamma/tau
MDVIEIDGASNTSVNDVRQIKDEVLFPPNSGRYKVYIIDEVHMLSNSAFNALLKTIEEPPPYIVFVFATTELHKVPATIKSRCQQFSFRLISIEMIQQILKETCEEMKIEYEEEALFWIARESTGSLRDAYTLFDQVASFSQGFIRSALIQEKLGLVELDSLNALAEACAAHDSAAAFNHMDRILGNGVSIEQFVIDLAGYYRSLLLIKNGIGRESLLGFSPGRFSSPVLEALDSIRLEHALSFLLDLYRNIRYSVSPRFELETAVFRLSALDRWISPEELGQMVRDARNVLGAAQQPAAPARQNASPPQEEAPPERRPPQEEAGPPNLQRLRELVIEKLRQEKTFLALGLEKSLRWEQNGDEIRIPVNDELTAKLIQDEAAFIRDTLTRTMGRPISLNLENRSQDPVETVRRVFQGTVIQSNP